MLVKFLNSSFEVRKQKRKMKGFERNEAVPISEGSAKDCPPQQLRAMNQSCSKTISQSLRSIQSTQDPGSFNFRI